MNNGEPHFDFGRNWKRFSEHALTAAHVEDAKQDLMRLLGDIDLRDRSFLDIGFGQGLALLSAASLGATAVGCDIDPLCMEVFRKNRQRYFPSLSERDITIVLGSILDDRVVESLRAKSPNKATGCYDIVYSWGVLHHTGALERAICTAASFVATNGYLVVSIYARHWSSNVWRVIKRLYSLSPRPVQKLFVAMFYPVIFLAKLLITRTNPFRKSRGMDFYYDVVDGVGGYPYEYAATEIEQVLHPRGFEIVRVIPPQVPTGCNEFAFQRRAAKIAGARP